MLCTELIFSEFRFYIYRIFDNSYITYILSVRNRVKYIKTANENL